MNKILFIYFLIFNFTFASTLIKGVVLDDSGVPVPYANIYIKDTFSTINISPKLIDLRDQIEELSFGDQSSKVLNSFFIIFGSISLHENLTPKGLFPAALSS